MISEEVNIKVYCIYENFDNLTKFDSLLDYLHFHLIYII